MYIVKHTGSVKRGESRLCACVYRQQLFVSKLGTLSIVAKKPTGFTSASAVVCVRFERFSRATVVPADTAESAY